jgi:hypothetical protein
MIILLICLGIAITGLVLSIVFEKDEKEITKCPECQSDIENKDFQMGDMGFGIRPIVFYKKCTKCGWTN